MAFCVGDIQGLATLYKDSHSEILSSVRPPLAVHRGISNCKKLEPAKLFNWHRELATEGKEIGGDNWRKLEPAKLFNWHWAGAVYAIEDSTLK